MWPVHCEQHGLHVTVPGCAGIISFLLLGIEEIGVQIEEPFGILPLCALHTLMSCCGYNA